MAATMIVGCGSKEEKAEEPAAKEETSDVQAESVEQRTVYVTPDWVKSVQDGNQEDYEDYVIAEVGYGDVKDCASYNEGHVSGAIYVDNCEVEDAIGDVESPYNLLPAADIEKYLLGHGITKDTKVILYGADVSGTARQAFGYIYAGVEDVKILNGGIEAWKAAGYGVETDVNEGEEAKDFGVKVPAHPEYWTSMEEAKDRLANDDNFKLVSVRSEEEWLGKTSGYNYMDKAGEPEGAVWDGGGPLDPYDMSGYMHDDGTIKNLDEIKTDLWRDVDFTLDNDLAFYCGTGWRACIPFLICYEAGYDNVSVYDGGWYEWMLHDENPVQVGDPASDDCEYTTVGELPTDKAAK
ncbi:sulfurtransferase [Extibacter muris]|uniref:Sulfurtransferase n=2 Tax=Extibacter muris TaxID=1796622 RepID=A0A4R4FDX8_9FIRM|nr:sulfurtransferase [Extibacter muris]